MADLSHTQVRDLITSLSDMWDAAIQGEYTGRDDIDEARVVAIHTTTHHAVKMSRALLKVDSPDAGIESVIIARTILECAITSIWLLLTPDSGHLLIRDGAQSRKAALKELIAQGEDGSPGYEQAMDIGEFYDEKGLRGGANIQDRCRSFRGGDHLYVVYRAFSARSHPGLGISDFYVEEDPNSEIGMVFIPDATDDARDATIGVAATALILALQADELARRKPHRTTQIKKAALRLGINIEFVRPDGSTLAER